MPQVYPPACQRDESFATPAVVLAVSLDMQIGLPYDDLQDVFSDAIGATVPPSAIDELLDGRFELIGQILEWGANDTVVRETLVSLMTIELVGRGCPTYGDVQAGFDAEAFYEAVTVAVQARGWATR
jgi:hypothetical protein